MKNSNLNNNNVNTNNNTNNGESMTTNTQTINAVNTNLNKGEVMQVTFTVNGNTYQLPKLTNRRLYKLLRTEGLLPAESVGKTSSEVLECGSMKVYYKDIELFIGVENKEDNMQDVNELCLFIQPQAELEAYEKELTMFNKLTEGKTVWDMVENHVRMFGAPTNVEVDKDGHEIGADKVLNMPVQDIYTPDEFSEYFSTDSKGVIKIGNVGDAELIRYNFERHVYEQDTTDKENIERSKPVFTRKNTITEDEAMSNLITYINKLEEVTTYEELRELQKEVFAKQNEHEYSLMYFFPKGGSKAFWTAYKTKKAVMLKEMEVDMEKELTIIKGFITRLETVQDFKQLAELRQEVFSMPYNPATYDAKGEFWAAYKVKKAELAKQSDAFYAEKREAIFKETVKLINDHEGRMLDVVSQDIYKSRLPLKVKKVLWTKINQKKDGQAITFDMERAIAYLHAEAKSEREEWLAKQAA